MVPTITMSFAVVKFLQEGSESDTDVVSEIPVGWLSKNNKFCKWPPKHSSLYISKSFPPQENWKEYPVEVESICDTLTEARNKVQEVEKDHLGRGFRKIKNTNYYSPAEEEERHKGIAKEREKGSTKKFQSSFVKMLSGNATVAMQEDSTLLLHDESPIMEDLYADAEPSTEDPLVLLPLESSTTTPAGSDIEGPNTPADGTIVFDKDMEMLQKKIDTMFNFLSTIKVDIMEIKEKLQIIFPSKIEIKNLPIALPMKNLNDIESLENFIKSSEENKQVYINFVRHIGGNNSKDFILRICRSLFSNHLAEICSWLGRKNNYAVGNLQLMDLAFQVVHQKISSSTQKEFESNVSEWLRHAKQRRLREK